MEIGTSKLHKNVLINKTCYIEFIVTKNKFFYICHLFLLAVKFLLILIRIKMKNKKVEIIFNGSFLKEKSIKLKLFKKLLYFTKKYLKAKIIKTPTIQALLTENYFLRLISPLSEKIKDLENAKTISVEEIDYDERWVYSEFEYNLFKKHKKVYEKIKVIGYDRMCPKWPKFISDNSGIEFRKFLKSKNISKNDVLIPILLTYPTYVWLPDKIKYSDLIMSVIEVLRKQFPKCKILLKCKPRYDKKWFGLDQTKMELDNIFFTDFSIAVLAYHTKFATTINETSGIFDFLSLGKPIIEFSKYSVTWKKNTNFNHVWDNVPGVYFSKNTSEFFQLLNKKSIFENQNIKKNILSKFLIKPRLD